ncbi:peptide-methionine (S)-S-oxide reductase MsrA [Myxococcaceae bacterium GXIMD 01537]
MSRFARSLALCLSVGVLGGAAARDAQGPTLATATFAGGCFWSMEKAFDEVPGVVSTTSGYTGGTVADPTYEDVSTGRTGHVEAVKVRFDPSRISYAQLLDAYWHNVDPLTADGQFCDKGTEYRSVIFVEGPEQQRLARESKRRLETSGRFTQPLVTEIRPAAAFYPAEEYHQDYAHKNPAAYQRYRTGCRRDARLAQLWGP